MGKHCSKLPCFKKNYRNQLNMSDTRASILDHLQLKNQITQVDFTVI